MVNWDYAVELKWNTAAHAANYRVLRRTQGEGWTELGDSGSGYFEDTNAVSGQTYYYTLVCLDENGNYISAYSDGVSNVHVDMPQITSFQNNDGSVKVSWNRPNGAVKFRLYEKRNGSWTKLTETAAQSFVDYKVSDDAEKLYTVRALDAKGKFVSGYSKDGWTNAYLANPEFDSITNRTDGVELKWTRARHAEKYRVYRKTVAEKSWHAIGESEDSLFLDTSAPGGVDCLYTIRAISYDGKRFLSYHNAGVRNTYYKQPEITNFTNSVNGVRVTWSKCDGASYYRLYQRVGNKWSAIVTTRDLFYNDAAVENGISKTYTVRALDGKKKFITGYKAEGWTNTFYSAPKLTSVKRTDGGVMIEWDKISGIESYRVYRKQQGKSWGRIIDSVSGNSFTDSDYNTDVFYTYTVRCLDGEGNVVSAYFDNAVYYKNGVRNSGLVVENGKKYLYDEDGELAVNRIVSYNGKNYYADKTGAFCESEEIRLAVDFVTRYGKGETGYEKLQSSFKALWNNYPYEMIFGIPTTGDRIREMAIHVFKEKKGNCFCNAAAVTCIARVCGYDSRTITGMIHSVYGGTTAHGWAEVNVDGKWLICDADEQRRNPADKYFMTTYEDYKIKPLNYEHCYTLACEGGKSSWTKNY